MWWRSPSGCGEVSSSGSPERLAAGRPDAARPDPTTVAASQRARRPSGRPQDRWEPPHVALVPTPRRPPAGPPGPSERRGARNSHLAESEQSGIHIHYRHPARSRGLRSHGTENLQAGRSRALEHPRVAPLMCLAPPRHGRAARGRLRHPWARLHPSDDGRLRPPAGAITDACRRGDAPCPVDRSAARHFNPLATELATNLVGDGADKGVNWDSVGRPGLDPGTLGLKVPCSSG